MILVFTTFAKLFDARKMARKIISKKLATCASIRKISSIYIWKEKLREEAEYELELKAGKKNYKKIEREILASHPYELPAIYSLEARDAEKKYKNWVKN